MREYVDHFPENEKRIKPFLGWERSQEREHSCRSLRDSLMLSRKEGRAIIITLGIFLFLFVLSFLLLHHPLKGNSDIPFYDLIDWKVAAVAVFFEFLDSAAGMGYGTAMTPLLLLMGFEPLQIVPAVMMQQAAAGLSAAFLHNELANVQWRVRPLSESLKLTLSISLSGILATLFSITSVYALLKLHNNWIKLYVSLLLLVMAAVTLVSSRKDTREYKPGKMLFFGFLAGMNKGIGGGGYGPVITLGGMISGVPVKSMMAVTSFSEGVVCVAASLLWFFLARGGVEVDLILLPSMMLGSLFAVAAAPYVVRVVPQKAWNAFVPLYSCLIALFCLFKVLGNLL